MPQPATKTNSTPSERREIMLQAADELTRAARTSVLITSYARMNPAAKLRANVFFFGVHGQPPRVVIFGPWAYVHAPAAKLPKGVEHLPDDLRGRKHLGALHARLLLDSSKALVILRRIVKSLQRTQDADAARYS